MSSKKHFDSLANSLTFSQTSRPRNSRNNKYDVHLRARCQFGVIPRAMVRRDPELEPSAKRAELQQHLALGRCQPKLRELLRMIITGGDSVEVGRPLCVCQSGHRKSQTARSSTLGDQNLKVHRLARLSSSGLVRR